MASLKSKKRYPFRNFGAIPPTPEQVREEMESMYDYLVEITNEVIEELRVEAVPDE